MQPPIPQKPDHGIFWYTPIINKILLSSLFRLGKFSFQQNRMTPRWLCSYDGTRLLRAAGSLAGVAPGCARHGNQQVTIALIRCYSLQSIPDHYSSFSGHV